MSPEIRVIISSFLAEITRLSRARLLIILVVIQSVTFLLLVTLFGMTGSWAPTALIDNDRGYYSQEFIKNLQNAHHSFSLRFNESYQSAMEKIKSGDLVAIIVIPKGFTDGINRGSTVPINVVIDNIDTDMSMDIQRALPAAITDFGEKQDFYGIRVRTVETDLIDHDTHFIVYMVVSSLILTALIISGILNGVAMAQEYESNAFNYLKISPVSPFFVSLGKLLANSLVSINGVFLAAIIAIGGWGIRPVDPVGFFAILIFCIILFGVIGAAFGVMLKKTMPVTSLIFGISLPLYLFSGTYEPERFDGNLIWIFSHFTPVYYAVGIIEKVVLNLNVTPEPVWVNYLALCGWLMLFSAITWRMAKKN